VVLPASGCEMIAKVRRRAKGFGSVMSRGLMGKRAVPLARPAREGKGAGRAPRQPVYSDNLLLDIEYEFKQSEARARASSQIR
jgi:hypothetical protein